MKYFNLTTAMILSLATFNFTFAHGGYDHGGMGMMGGSTMGHCMMGYDMMSYAECPTMNVNYLISHRDELGLSKTQISKLKEIRENNQKEAATLRADLNAAMSELQDLLNEDELNSAKIKAVNKKVEKLKSELRWINREIYASAKLLLTEKQLNRMKDTKVLDEHHMHGNYGCCGMMR